MAQKRALQAPSLSNPPPRSEIWIPAFAGTIGSELATVYRASNS